MKVKSFLAIVLFVLLLFPGCDTIEATVDEVAESLNIGSTGDGSVSGASASLIPSVALPDETPYWDNSAIDIDENFINSFAEDYCDLVGDDVDVLEFIAGNLPLASVDECCQFSQTKESMAKYLGNMYISGYYGGVWLRDVLFSNTGDVQPGDLVGAIMEILPDLLKNITEMGGDKLVFKTLAAAVGNVVDISLDGSSSQVITMSYLSINPFLMIYGYDYGYYYYLLDNPPEGLSSVTSPLQTESFIDCSMNGIELVTLNKYKPVLDDLLNPKYWNVCNATDMRWTEMNAAMNLVGKGSTAVGELVWDIIMSNDEMFEDAYLPLLDLSARFMLVSELTLLPTMKCYAERDIEAGRCGLLQEGCMMTWLVGYVMGLASDLPEGTFPELSFE
ncbi:MAG TPA: hypothetical protein PK926_02935 [Spirochaetota bacterium]|nr:hypothetical protein [Spirochaetota bacterium]HPI87964.1 hypothetical protein [Spirochaetota bacterium]HPR46675.1 hypothetical protein [Spirochaetota bacterium]